MPGTLSTKAGLLLTELGILHLLTSSKSYMRTGRCMGITWGQVTLVPATKPLCELYQVVVV